jgi:hypothetical protein
MRRRSRNEFRCRPRAGDAINMRCAYGTKALERGSLSASDESYG